MEYKVGDVISNTKMSAQIVDILNTRKYRGQNTIFYKLKCLTCGCEFERDKYTAEKREVGCPICTNRKIVPGVNDISTTDPWMVPFFQGGIEEAQKYCSGSSKSIYLKCPVCGRVKNTKMNICDLKRYGGFQCVCHDGKTFPNKFIYGIAEELKRTNQIKEFKEEFKIDGKFYDMCFINEMILVEMDSGLNHGKIIQKHKPNKFIPVTTFLNDTKKDEIAKDNDYSIIRIDCYKSEFEYIKENIINSELSNIFDLKIINWNNVLKLCTTNLIEEVSNYKREHPEALAVEIAPLFGLSDVTVRKYLKMGASLGWCVFDHDIEVNNYIKKMKGNRPNEIPVLVDPDDEDFEPKFYDSLEDLENNSITDFGEKIWADTIRNNYNEKRGCSSISGYDIYFIKEVAKWSKNL